MNQKIKDWWELTDREREHKNNQTILFALFLYAPGIALCFLISGYFAQLLTEEIKYSNIYGLTILLYFFIFSLILLWTFFKILDKFGIKE